MPSIKMKTKKLLNFFIWKVIINSHLIHIIGIKFQGLMKTGIEVLNLNKSGYQKYTNYDSNKKSKKKIYYFRRLI